METKESNRQLTNPEKDQDRAEEMLDNWRKFGYTMFPQQRQIYGNLTQQFRESIHPNPVTVLEAGCGSGEGAAILERSVRVSKLISTDKLKNNVEFAKNLYPWIDFREWDISKPWTGPKCDIVVAVEVVEHVADLAGALRNLINAASKEVWFSTPNGKGKEKPSSNPYHTNEYEPGEVLENITTLGIYHGRYQVLVYSWENFTTPLLNPLHTDCDPLVYRIKI